MFHDFKINLLACLILVVSSTVFFKNYQNLQSSLQERGILVRNIKDGQSQFHFIQKQACVANITFKTAHEQMLGLKVDLVSENFQGNASLFFNPLGQFVGGQARMHKEAELLLVDIRGVSSIHLRMLGDFEGHEIKKTIEIPGHLELSPSNDFTLQYPKFLEFKSSPIIQKISKLNLSLKEGHCSEMKAFNLKVEK